MPTAGPGRANWLCLYDRSGALQSAFRNPKSAIAGRPAPGIGFVSHTGPRTGPSSCFKLQTSNFTLPSIGFVFTRAQLAGISPNSFHCRHLRSSGCLGSWLCFTQSATWPPTARPVTVGFVSQNCRRDSLLPVPPELALFRTTTPDCRLSAGGRIPVGRAMPAACSPGRFGFVSRTWPFVHKSCPYSD